MDALEQANKQIKSGNRLNLIGGIVGGVGQLADAINAIYQTSKGRIPLPIGAPITAIGGGISGFGKSKTELGQRNSALATVQGIPGIDDTQKGLLAGAISAGYPEQAFKGAFDVMAAERKQPQLDFENQLKYLNLISNIEKGSLDRDFRKEKFEETQSSTLQARYGNAQDIANTIFNIEDKIGFNLDAYNPKTGKVKKVDAQGKEYEESFNLPGKSIKGLGRVTFYNEKARDLQSTAGSLFNTVLRDRSGAAVTTPEMDRLRNEFGEGKFNSETNLIGAMQRYKSALRTQLQNIEAGFDPDVVQTYRDRGGLTSSVFGDNKRKVGNQPANKVIYNNLNPEDLDSMSLDELMQLQGGQ